MFTWLDLKKELKALIWPNGVPENLEAIIDKYFVEAIIHLQRAIPSLQLNQVDVYPFCATYFKCATSVIDAPKGRITRVYTVEGEDYCDPVPYKQREKWELECWSRGFMELVTPPENKGLSDLPYGFKYPDRSTDSKVGRALTGLWALDRNKLIVAPWLQSTESLVVEWHGIKREWKDEDAAPEFADIQRAMRLYISMEFSREWDCDLKKYGASKLSFDDCLGDLIYQDRQETKVHKTHECSDEPDILWRNSISKKADEATPAESPSDLVFAVIGDYGMAGAGLDDVAALVKGWDPSFILTTGDNNYPSGDASTIDNANGKFREYIYPYKGSTPLESGKADAKENRFWPTLGNHDLDTNSGQPYLDYFTLPGNERYYDFVKDIPGGSIHFFCVNSGLRTDGSLAEPAGNNTYSPQGEWLQLKVLQSTATWKVVYFHHAPYTSEINHGPGSTVMRWGFKGADLVLTGHAHNYERLEVDGIPYIVNGAGGHSLRGFGTVLPESKVRYNADFGANRIKANKSKLIVEFFSRSGEAVDSLTLNK